MVLLALSAFLASTIAGVVGISTVVAIIITAVATTMVHHRINATIIDISLQLLATAPTQSDYTHIAFRLSDVVLQDVPVPDPDPAPEPESQTDLSRPFIDLVEIVDEPPAAEPAALEPAGSGCDIQFEPVVQSEGHKKIVQLVLPVLRQVLLDPSFEGRPARVKIKRALQLVKGSGNMFWGENNSLACFSRPRTVEDIVVVKYYDAVVASLS